MISNPVPERSRQSWAALVFILGTFLRRSLRQLWPLLVIAYLKPNSEGGKFAFILWVLIIITVVSLISSLVNYFRFYYWLDDRHLFIEQGVFKKTRLSVPFERIQSINTEQNLFYRLLGIVKIEGDTAGSKGSEVRIQAVSYELAQQIKEYVLSNRKAEIEAPEAEENVQSEETVVQGNILQRLSPLQLLKIGFSQNHLRAIGILLAFFFARYEDSREILDEQFPDFETISENAVSAGIMVYSAITVIILLGSTLASVITIFVRYFGFELSETRSGVRTVSGLLTKREKQINYSKTQIFQYTAGPVRRWLDLANVKVFQAASENQPGARTAVLTPGCSSEDLENLKMRFFSGKELPTDIEHTIKPVYVIRKSIFSVWLPVIAVAAFSIYLEEYYVLTGAAFWLLYGTFKNFMFQRYFRFGFNADVLHVRNGFWILKNRIIEWRTIQCIEIFQGLYQQQHNYADLVLFTAGGRIVLPYISLEQAQLLQNYALYKVESSKEEGM